MNTSPPETTYINDGMGDESCEHHVQLYGLRHAHVTILGHTVIIILVNRCSGPA